MKVLYLPLAAALLFAAFIVLPSFTVAQDTQDICRFFFNNTKIRDPESCSKYITCIDFVSRYSSCSGSTPFYDKTAGGCVKMLPENSTCNVDCTEAAGRFVPDPRSCKGYYWCHNPDTAEHGICPGTTHFNETQQLCIYKYESECRVHQFDFCNLVKDGINFNDESNCDKYFVCTKGKQTSKTCAKLYYNAATGQCIQKSLVSCNEHPVPKSVCGTVKLPKKNVFVADTATCRGYFFCAHPNLSGTGPDPNPRWGQCEDGKFFNAKTQKCIHPLDVKCEWDRCDGRNLRFVSATKKGCREYNRCLDGVTIGTLNCGNYFFQEETQTCVSNLPKMYTSCAT